jgi:hypothetical protein
VKDYLSAFDVDLSRPFTSQDRKKFIQNYAEYQARRTEALKLYEPMPIQKAFHQSRTYLRLYIGGNRSGKSVGTAVEFARAVQGLDPFNKYAKTNGKIYVVGKSLKHCADTIYPMLFRPGAFKIIQDELTGNWRTYRPWDPLDRLRKDDAILAPPLIPERMIDGSIGWKSKAKREIDTIRFTTGWEALFFSAEGQHPQGGKADLVWFDEEIPASKRDGPWFPEMSARLIDKGGVLMWSAAPQKGYDELYELYQRGLKQQDQYRMDPAKYPKPDIDIFHTQQEDNLYLGAAERARFIQNLSAEEALVRSKGHFTVSARLVYPEFSLQVHGYPLETEIPANWTIYMYVDPGHAICACLFAACPPLEECPDEEPMALAYDEIYIPQANAALFAQAVKEKLNDRKAEAFIIDMHGANPHEAGSGLSIYEQYEEALKALGVSSRTTGYGFLAGNDKIMAGITKVHSWMMVRQQEKKKGIEIPPHFRVRTNKDRTVSTVPNLVWELNRYPKQRVAGIVTDKPNDRGPTHLCQCVRYMAMHGPEYVEVAMRDHAYRRMTRFFDQLKADQRRGTSSGVSFGRAREGV